MKKSALRFTLLILSIPILLTIVSYYFLNKTKRSANHDYHIYITDFIILFVSGILTFFLILRNNKRKQAVLEKINQNNEAIRLSNERYDIVAKATSDTIWDWQLSNNSFTWNKGIQGIFGYKKEEIIYDLDWWFSKIHSEDRLRMSVTLYSLVEERVERWQDEYRFECADGSYKYILDRGFLVTDSSGKPTRMIGAMQDITKQKLEEERLKLLEMVIMQTKDAVIITEANQCENEIPKITYVNPAFTSITGYKSKEVIGKSANSFIHKEAISNEIKNVSNALKTKNEFNFEALNSKKNGENYWVDFSMIPINNAEGEHSHWISIQREITEEKKKEKEKEQLIRELIQNNSDLKQFSYITSHNLRAPLSNLTGLLQLLDDIEIKDEELLEILNGFKISTNLLNETVNDLIKVIIIKDSPSIYKEKILVQEVFDSIKIQIKTLLKNTEPQIELDFENAPYIFTNKSYLESILLNLMTNAIKYKSERPLKIEITASETDENFQLTFEDNGIGIDLELNKDKIFGLYQRFHDYPDSKGLGLYLVKSQIESLGGSIKVKSKVDQGTKFTILFNKQ
jgi:PAS domain S-box-containing protein